MELVLQVIAHDASAIDHLRTFAKEGKTVLNGPDDGVTATVRWSDHVEQRGIFDTLATIAGHIDLVAFGVGIATNIISNFLWHRFGPNQTAPRQPGSDQIQPRPETTVIIVYDARTTEITPGGLTRRELDSAVRRALEGTTDADAG